MNTDYLKDWDVHHENRKAQFMQHLYRHSGRTNGLFTGLWEEWCELNGGDGEGARDAFFYCTNCHEDPKFFSEGAFQ